MFFLFSTPIALFILLLAFCKWISGLSQREKQFWNEQEIYGNTIAIKLYKVVKFVLAAFAAVEILAIFIVPAYGKIPTITSLTDPEFLKILLGIAIMLVPQIGIFFLIRLIKRLNGSNNGKIILFFLITIFVAVITCGIFCIAG